MPPFAWTVREADAADINRLGGLWRELADFHARRDPYFALADDANIRRREFIETQLSGVNSKVYLAESGGFAAGYCLGRLKNSPTVFRVTWRGEILELMVTKTHRREGIGKLLLTAMLSFFASQGVYRIEAGVAAKNRTASRFWEKMGFVSAVHTQYIDRRSPPTEDDDGFP